jgi:hypothetical protein
MLAFCRWLEHTTVGAGIRESLWLFPVIETLHLLGMALLLATVTAYDLRLLGLMMRRRPVTEVARQLLPWTWFGFAVQIITGSLLFSSEALKIYTNPAFRLKILLILLAGVQALVFHRLTYRNVSAWDADAPTPIGAKLAGALSLILWTGVVAAGRFIGFV